LWGDNTFDALMHQVVVEYLKNQAPRVLFVGYGETDEWAHLGRYDLTLRSAHQVDAFIAELWQLMQSMPAYRGSTTFIITTDHGRGNGLQDWKRHGEDVVGAEGVWMAVIGPDTPRLGERENQTFTQSQIASTLAALLGEDWRTGNKNAAAVVSGALRPAR
jgi:bisphosphoglycerate-independent phosphoglycerate mutase (AlkP superfamily)